jgi:hypothetical protein
MKGDTSAGQRACPRQQIFFSCPISHEQQWGRRMWCLLETSPVAHEEISSCTALRCHVSPFLSLSSLAHTAPSLRVRCRTTIFSPSRQCWAPPLPPLFVSPSDSSLSRPATSPSLSWIQGRMWGSYLRHHVSAQLLLLPSPPLVPHAQYPLEVAQNGGCLEFLRFSFFPVPSLRSSWLLCRYVLIPSSLS